MLPAGPCSARVLGRRSLRRTPCPCTTPSAARLAFWACAVRPEPLPTPAAARVSGCSLLAPAAQASTGSPRLPCPLPPPIAGVRAPQGHSRASAAALQQPALSGSRGRAGAGSLARCSASGGPCQHGATGRQQAAARERRDLQAHQTAAQAAGAELLRHRELLRLCGVGARVQGAWRWRWRAGAPGRRWHCCEGLPRLLSCSRMMRSRERPCWHHR